MTGGQTFKLTKAETSNTLLLVPPEGTTASTGGGDGACESSSDCTGKGDGGGGSKGEGGFEAVAAVGFQFEVTSVGTWEKAPCFWLRFTYGAVCSILRSLLCYGGHVLRLVPPTHLATCLSCHTREEFSAGHQLDFCSWGHPAAAASTRGACRRHFRNLTFVVGFGSANDHTSKNGYQSRGQSPC